MLHVIAQHLISELLVNGLNAKIFVIIEDSVIIIVDNVIVFKDFLVTLANTNYAPTIVQNQVGVILKVAYVVVWKVILEWTVHKNSVLKTAQIMGRAIRVFALVTQIILVLIAVNNNALTFAQIMGYVIKLAIPVCVTMGMEEKIAVNFALIFVIYMGKNL